VSMAFCFWRTSRHEFQKDAPATRRILVAAIRTCSAWNLFHFVATILNAGTIRRSRTLLTTSAIPARQQHRTTIPARIPEASDPSGCADCQSAASLSHFAKNGATPVGELVNLTLAGARLSTNSIPGGQHE
jgi:hypothetical protein